METKNLSAICQYRRETVSVTNCDKKTFISTENMLPNKAGISLASKCPTSGNVSKYHPGDVLVSNIRPYFKKIHLANTSGTCSNDVLVFQPNHDVCTSEYLFCVLSTDDFFSYATTTAKGTKMPRGDRNAIMNYQINWIPVHEQSKIAEPILNTYRKIKLNEQINDNLFAQAKLLFDNEIANVSSIPSEWKKGTLLDIATYTNGLAMQRFRPADDEIGIPVLKIKELRQGFCDSASELCSTHINEEYLISDGDVIFSWSGSLLIDLWGGDICGLNQHLFKLTSSEYPKWFYYLWTLHHLDRFITIAADKATTMGHIKRGDLAQAEVIIPSNDDINRIGAAISPIVNLIIANKVESRKMAALRDKMLIKLITNAQNQS